MTVRVDQVSRFPRADPWRSYLVFWVARTLPTQRSMRLNDMNHCVVQVAPPSRVTANVQSAESTVMSRRCSRELKSLASSGGVL